MTINDFVVSHNKTYINYCEAVIYPNGNIEYAIPSHQIKLQEIYGVPYNPFSDKKSEKEIKFWKTIPVDADVCEWLCEDLKVISIWYNQAIIPIDYTEDSLKSYIELVKEGCVSHSSNILVSIEKSLIDLRSQERFRDLDNLILERNQKQEYIKSLISSI